MKFVDRERELGRLCRAVESDGRALVIVYGRRRVGKSTLIKKALDSRRGIFFQADETSSVNQLRLLAAAVDEQCPGFGSAIYPEWDSILAAINRSVVPGTTLCLDEFPYLVKSFPGLPSVIQNFWDNSSPKFNLILCGSSQRAMYDELLNEQSPLYGRADCIIKLQPIDIGYIGEAMELKTGVQCVENYALWGGIPRYWQLAMPFKSWRGAFEELMLRPDSTLADEPNRLLRDDLRDITMSRTLLSIIGSGANRMSEIASRAGKPASELTGPLRRLIDMGYVAKEIPFGENPKNSKKTLYKISDRFLDAYNRFVAPNVSLISLGRMSAVRSVVERSMGIYMGQAWESICRNTVSGNIVDGVLYNVASRWWGNVTDGVRGKAKEVEIDLLAESVDGATLLAGECKWTSGIDSVHLLEELRHKVESLPFAARYREVRYALFLRESPHGNATCRVFLPEEIIALSREINMEQGHYSRETYLSEEGL